MVNLQSLGLDHNSQDKKIHGLTNALIEVSSILRGCTDLEAITDEILLIYGSVTKNNYILDNYFSKTNRRDLTKTLKPELRWFVQSNLINLLANTITKLQGYFDIQLYSTTVFGKKVGSSLTEHDLNLIEIEVRNKCLMVNDDKRNGYFEDHRAEPNDIPNIHQLLGALLAQFSILVNAQHGQTQKNLDTYQVSGLHTKDPTSITNILCITYLIGICCKALCEYKHFDSPKEDESPDLIKLFTNITSKGAMTVPGIICCSNAETNRLFAYAVVNKDGNVGYTEKLLLRNCLVLRKLSSEL